MPSMVLAAGDETDAPNLDNDANLISSSFSTCRACRRNCSQDCGDCEEEEIDRSPSSSSGASSGLVDRDVVEAGFITYIFWKTCQKKRGNHQQCEFALPTPEQKHSSHRSNHQILPIKADNYQATIEQTKSKALQYAQTVLFLCCSFFV